MIRDLTKSLTRAAESCGTLAEIVTILDGREEEYHCIEMRMRAALFDVSKIARELESIRNQLINHIDKYGHTENNNRTEAKGVGDGN